MHLTRSHEVTLVSESAVALEEGRCHSHGSALGVIHVLQRLPRALGSNREATWSPSCCCGRQSGRVVVAFCFAFYLLRRLIF